MFSWSQEEEQHQLLEAAKTGSVAIVTRLITTRHIDPNTADLVSANRLCFKCNYKLCSQGGGNWVEMCVHCGSYQLYIHHQYVIQL